MYKRLHELPNGTRFKEKNGTSTFIKMGSNNNFYLVSIIGKDISKKIYVYNESFKSFGLIKPNKKVIVLKEIEECI
jgi:hypothetical protein